MAGRGPAPKPPERRARHDSRDDRVRRIARHAAPQPKLPPKTPDGEPWPKATRAWWKTWGASPLTEGFTAVEWDELQVAAVLHALFWSGEIKVASELRLRTGKFGATPEDRLRLRIEFADEEPEAPAPRRALRLVDES